MAELEQTVDIRAKAGLGEYTWTELVWRDKSLQDFMLAYYGYDLIERDTIEYNLEHYRNLANKLGEKLAGLKKDIKQKEKKLPKMQQEEMYDA